MTHAELLRKHANDATNEGGMWFSGEYLSRIAETAESLEDENAKLRTLCRDMYLVVSITDMGGMRIQAHGKEADWRSLKERFNELMGIETG